MQTALRLFVCAVLTVASVEASAGEGPQYPFEGSPPFTGTDASRVPVDGIGGGSAEPEDTSAHDDAAAAAAARARNTEDFVVMTWTALP
jgi:hypothetical protein